MQALIHFINVGSKPKFSMTLNMKLFLTLSNTFARLSFMIIPLSFRRILECRASWTRIMLSTICLPLMNPPWFSVMIVGRIVLILLAIIFVRILYLVLQREIVQNLPKLIAPFSFGTRARKDEFVPPPILVQF
jgi:hypothetical protein